MAKLTKKQKAQDGKVETTKLYPLADALNLVKDKMKVLVKKFI